MRKEMKASILENIKVIFVAGLIAIGFRSFLFEPFYIPSESMVPKLLIHDFIIASKYPYGYSRFSLPFYPKIFSGRVLEHPVERGDVIIFKGPKDPETRYIKRAIGVAGDRIQFKDGHLYLNGQMIKEEDKGEYLYQVDNGASAMRRMRKIQETLPNGKTYTVIRDLEYGFNNSKEYIVPANHVFGLGDNRDHSGDSRFEQMGYIPTEHLIGRAEFIFFSSVEACSWLEIWKWHKTILTIRLERFFNSLRAETQK
jgi:signal peptidase I